MKEGTLIFLQRPQSEEILLAMKKRGFGEGKWNGVGGKVENGETIFDAAIREAFEEIGVKIQSQNLEKKGELDFVFKGKSDFDQFVHVFFVTKWESDPVETEEMCPQWFNYTNIPYKDMWIDDAHWLPIVINGKKISAQFTFDQTGNTLLDMSIETH